MKMQDLEFKVDDLTLRGKVYLAQNPTCYAVLFIHGWTGKPNYDCAEVLANNGYSSMVFSLSGHNDSDGALEGQTRSRSLKELVAAYDEFRKLLPEFTKIGVAGNSYGGYLAPLLSADRQIAFIQMRVPANYPDELFDQKQLGQGHENPNTAKWRIQKLPADATKSLRALSDFAGPVQIIEAEKDEVIPHQTVMNYVNLLKSEGKSPDYHLLKDWPHSMGVDPARNQLYQKLLLDWLNEAITKN